MGAKLDLIIQQGDIMPAYTDMNNTITCKKCGSEIEISDALTHQIEEQVLASLKAQHKKDLEEVKKIAEEKAFEKASREIELKFKDKSNEADELKKQNKDLMDQLLEQNKSLRELKENDKKRDLEFQKKLESEEEKIRKEAKENEEKTSSLKIAELNKKLGDMEKALVDAQKKGQQGSQQLQGEVLELDLENRLKESFPHDDIQPIGKGVEGADINQIVKNSLGQIAGTITWETKRAKWKPSWIPKLKEDARKAESNITILVSEELPTEISNFKTVDGILITSYNFALPLAHILRPHLMQLARAKFTAANKDEKLESLYSYLQSETFRHRFEAYVEGILEMKIDLDTEKRSFERIWKKRDTQINRTLSNLTRMYGELQGIMGQALPDIKTLSLPSPTEEVSGGK